MPKNKAYFHSFMTECQTFAVVTPATNFIPFSMIGKKKVSPLSDINVILIGLFNIPTY